MIAAFMIIVARPISVFISLANSRMGWREKTFISWVGLRGAVPVVMATYPLVAGIGRAEYIFNVVFFVAITSLLIQGTSISIVAKLLGLSIPEPQKQDNQVEHTTNATVKNNMSYVYVPQTSASINKSIVDMKLPQNFLIVLIERSGGVIIPRGSTQIEAHDKLMVIAEKESLNQFREKINTPVG